MNYITQLKSYKPKEDNYISLLRGKKELPQKESNPDLNNFKQEIRELKAKGFSLEQIKEGIEALDLGKGVYSLADKAFQKGEVFIVRHGDAMDEEGSLGGWNNEGLSVEGKKHVEAGIKDLKDKNIELIITSDLRRARQSADMIGKELGVKVQGDSALRSWNIGKYAGTDPEDSEPILEDYAENRPEEEIPPNGESFNQYKDRILNAIQSISEEHEGENIAIVTHSHGIRIYNAWEKAGKPKDFSIDMKEYAKKSLKPGFFEKVKTSSDEIGELKKEGYSLDEVLEALKETNDEKSLSKTAYKIYGIPERDNQ